MANSAFRNVSTPESKWESPIGKGVKILYLSCITYRVFAKFIRGVNVGLSFSFLFVLPIVDATGMRTRRFVNTGRFRRSITVHFAGRTRDLRGGLDDSIPTIFDIGRFADT